MEEIKPKKERKFLKAVGKVAGILVQEFVLGLGRKFIGKKIDRIGNKRQALLIFLALFCNIAFASIDSIPYPITGNKQRLGWQTTGNGLVYRGRASDTITKPSNYANKDIKAYMLFDTVNNVLYSYIASKGGWKFNNSDTVIIQGVTMPFDSIIFNTAKDGTVGVGEVEYNDTQGSLIQGLKGGNVTNVIGQQLHQRVNNKTGGTLAKGTVVYLSGSQGNRITVAKALATSDPTSANTFGIVAEEILDNASGYVITEGLITNINTSALTQDSAVYLSGTTAGALTSTKPQAPIHGVYIGVCVKSNARSGELFIKIRNGQELDELHDVQITSPVDRASLYFKSSEGLWRDTTAALLVSDTAAMLSNYLLSGTASSTYLTQSSASSTYTPLTRSISTTSPLQGGGDLSSNRTFSILSASESQSGILTTTAQNIGGSKAFKANIVADSFIYLNNTSPIPTTLLGLNTSGNVNNVGRFSLGAGLSITFGSLLTDTNFVVTRFDTASMLTNYLRTGTAASTYLPLTGGELTGALSGTTGTFTGLNVNNTTTEGILTLQGYDNNTATRIQFKTGNEIRRQIIVSTAESNMEFRTSTVGGTQGGYSFYTRRNPNAENLAFDIDVDGNSNFYGTLGVTGFSTFSTGAVINENSNDSDTRIESDGNANMVFVDASTDRVGIGTSSPSKTLDVNGELKIATTTATPTSLLGKDGNNVVGNVRVISPLSIAGDSINLNTVPILKGGTGATTAATARTNLGATTRGANTFLLTDIGTISFLRYNADNTVSQRAADGMRSDLGGTTIGQSMFTLTNPSAITFPRYNADNTVSALSAADFRTAIGAGTGSGNGTVTNVTGTLPISVANGTTTPSITIANASTTASGVVTTGTQSIAGNKTFTGDLATSGAFSATGFSTLTGGASVGTMATTSSLTHILGVNSSNAIGEIALGNLALSSGTLNVNDASASVSGVVNTTTQSFAGNKTFTGNVNISTGTLDVGSTGTFGGRLKTNWLERNYAYSTSSSFTVSVNTTWQDINTGVLTTLTLPDAATYPGKEIHLRQTGLGNLQSASSNIIPFATAPTGSAVSSILTASTHRAVTLVSDGTNWIIMQRSDI